MSAFLCSPLHTAVVAQYLCSQPDGPSIVTFPQVCKALRKVNNRALTCRYGDKPQYLKTADFPELSARAKAWIESHNPADMLRVIQCFEYQCSEGDAMGTYGASFIFEALRYAEKPAAAHLPSAVWSI
jgi:hypothetical protein